jgi:hypothetical protein
LRGHTLFSAGQPARRRTPRACDFARCAGTQVGDELNPSDVAAIVSWLGAFTGALPVAYIAAPKLPD